MGCSNLLYLYDLEPSHFYRGTVLLISNCELFFLVGRKSVYHSSIHLCSDSFLPFGQQYPPARSLHEPHKQEVPSSHHLPQHKFPPVVQETVLSYSCYVLLQPKESWKWEDFLPVVFASWGNMALWKWEQKDTAVLWSKIHFKEHVKTGVNTQISTQGTSYLKIKDRNN